MIIRFLARTVSENSLFNDQRTRKIQGKRYSQAKNLCALRAFVVKKRDQHSVKFLDPSPALPYRQGRVLLWYSHYLMGEDSFMLKYLRIKLGQ